MNLPTVTVEAGEFGPAGYMPDLDDGTYALLRVTDGQTFTAKKMWRHGPICPIPGVVREGWCGMPECEIGGHWVLLVNGADMEEGT